MNTCIDQKKIADLLESAISELPKCQEFSTSSAAVCCAECYRTLSWNQVQFNDLQCSFICSGCLTNLTAKTKRDRILSIFTKPLFYIVFGTLVTALLFICGYGRISIATLQAQDQEKPPYKQKLGMMYLNQAARARTRVELLETFGPENDIPKWATLAAQALKQADELWEDSHVSADLKIGQAIMLARAGLSSDAYNMLLNINDIPQDTKLYYHFYRGKLAAQLGYKKECVNDWDIILKQALNERFDILEMATKVVAEMADSYSLEMTDDIWRKKVRRSTGLSLGNSYVYSAVVSGFKTNKISSLYLKHFEEKFGTYFDLNKPKPPPKNKPLVERIEE